MKRIWSFLLAVCLGLCTLPALSESGEVPVGEAETVRGWINAFFAGQRAVPDTAPVTYDQPLDEEGNPVDTPDEKLYSVDVSGSEEEKAFYSVNLSDGGRLVYIILLEPSDATPAAEETDGLSARVENLVRASLGADNMSAISFRALRFSRTLPVGNNAAEYCLMTWMPADDVTLGGVTLPANTLVECFTDAALTRLRSVIVYLP